MKRMYGRTLKNRWKDLKMVLWKPWLTVTYEDITVHYKWRLQGGGMGWGQDLVRFVQSRQMPKQGRVFEWCAGPAFIGFSLLARGCSDTLCVADINPYAVRALQRTIAANGLEDRVSAYLSDNLKQIPESERWDLVVGSPVHFADEQHHGSLRAHDPGWSIHRSFYENVAKFLAPGGVVLLHECCLGSSAETFKPMIEENGLKIVYNSGPIDLPEADDRFYFLASMRADEPAPNWLR